MERTSSLIFSIGSEAPPTPDTPATSALPLHDISVCGVTRCSLSFSGSPADEYYICIYRFPRPAGYPVQNSRATGYPLRRTVFTSRLICFLGLARSDERDRAQLAKKPSRPLPTGTLDEFAELDDLNPPLSQSRNTFLYSLNSFSEYRRSGSH